MVVRRVLLVLGARSGTMNLVSPSIVMVTHTQVLMVPVGALVATTGQWATTMGLSLDALHALGELIQRVETVSSARRLSAPVKLGTKKLAITAHAPLASLVLLLILRTSSLAALLVPQGAIHVQERVKFVPQSPAWSKGIEEKRDHALAITDTLAKWCTSEIPRLAVILARRGTTRLPLKHVIPSNAQPRGIRVSPGSVSVMLATLEV